MKEDNQAVIKALNMFGRIPEQWELLEEIERLQKVVNDLSVSNDAYLFTGKDIDVRDKEIERLKKTNSNLENAISLNRVRELHKENERLKEQNKGLQDDYDIANIQANYFIDLSDDLAEENERLNNITKNINKILKDDDLCHVEKLQEIHKLVGSDKE